MKLPSLFIYLLLPILTVSSCVMELSDLPVPEENLGIESMLVPDGFDYEMYTSQQVDVGFQSTSGRILSSESMQYAIIGSDENGGYHNLESGYIYLADGLDITINRPLHIKELTLYTKYQGNAQFYSLEEGPLYMSTDDLIIDDAVFEEASSRVLGGEPDCNSFLGNATKIDCKKDEVEIKSSASFVSIDIEFFDGTVASYSPGEIGDLSSKDTKWKFKEKEMIGDYSLGQVKNFTVYADCKTSAKEVGTALVTFANPCADEAVDSDNDGVLDDYDIAPNDANVASATYLPAYDKYATYAFEDLWPYKGDYDFNDLVVSHNATVMMNGEKMVTKVKYDLIIRAIGARFNNDLSLSFTDPQRSMTVANITPANVKYEVIAVDDLSEISLLRVKELFNSSDLINTDESQPFKEPIQVSIELTFNGSISADNFKVDEYLRINQEPGRELHKPGQPYTSLIDLNMLGDGDDDTTPGMNKYYKTTDNLPWVLEIPTEWEYPREGTDITKAYPKFKAFAQGDSHEAWYTEGNGNKVAEHIYKR